jgi:radical SAM protein (TIGR01212 family)
MVTPAPPFPTLLRELEVGKPGTGTVSSSPFRRLSAYLVERYGEKVYKVSLRGGFTCPNRDGTLSSNGCTFCSGIALEPVGYSPEQSLAEQLTSGMAYIRKRHGARRFIAYYHDYSATYAPVDRLAALYRPALVVPEVVALAVSTRPDCLPRQALDLLQEISSAKDLWIEIGLQLADDQMLQALNRGHTVDDFVKAVAACHDRQLPVCAHVILGLPGASVEDELATARLIADLGIWGVKLHAFHVIKGTEMAGRLAAGEVALLSREQHVDRVIGFIEQLPPETVIHRVTGEAPPRLTVAPDWTTNKLAVLDAVIAGFTLGQTWQGRLFDPKSSVSTSCAACRSGEAPRSPDRAPS